MKSISLFRDKSKFESLLSVINSLPRRASLWYLGPRCGLGSPFTWLKQLANPQTPLCLISLPTLLGDFLKFSLLSYNLHTIQFACFMYTIQWFLVYLQSCVTIITSIGFVFFFGCKTKGILFLQPEMEPMQPALKGRSLNCWTAGKS